MKNRLFIGIILAIAFMHLVHGAPYPGSSYITYVHTDRYCYVSGDDIFLKGYHINSSNPEQGTELALYIDISSLDSSFIIGHAYRLQKGLASGILSIPDSLRTGEYLLRAYTAQSLKQANNKVLFSKRLFISNRFGNNGYLAKENQNRQVNSEKSLFEESNSKLLDIQLSDTVFKQRSLVKSTLKAADAKKFHASVTVKRVSDYEFYYAQKSSHITKARYGNVDAESKNKDLIIGESKGIVIKGQVTNTDNEPIADALVFVAEEGSQLNFRAVVSDSVGKFCFLYPEFTGDKQTYTTCYNAQSGEYISNAVVTFENRFLNNKTSAQIFFEGQYEKSEDTLNLQKAIISKAYKINNIVKQKDSSIRALSFEQQYLVDKFNFMVDIDNYVDLEDFIEIDREILPQFRIKKQDSIYTYHITKSESTIVHLKPLVFVDGVPLVDIEKILKWGSKKIKQINIRIDPRYYGDVAFNNGLVFIWTREQDFWSAQSDVENYQHTFNGFQLPVDIVFPDYSEKNDWSIPDFRQTQYWNSDLTADTSDEVTFEFYTSDEKGWFEVVVEGIVNEKQPVYLRKLIRVE